MGGSGADIAFAVGGGKGDGVGADEPLRRRIAVMAAAIHADRAVARRRRRAVIQRRRIGGAVGPAIAGRQRALRIPRRRADRIGHYDLRGRRRHHAMTVGGGEGHRVGAGKLRVRHIGISAVGPQTDRAMARRRLGAGGQSGAVRHPDGAADGLLRRFGPARRAVGQGIADGHMGNELFDRARRIGNVGGKGYGINPDKAIGIGLIDVSAIGIDRHRAMGGGGRGVDPHIETVGGRIAPGKTCGQRSAGIAGSHRNLIGGGDHRSHRRRRRGRGGGRCIGRA